MADDTPIPERLRQPVERAARDVALQLLDKADRERQRLKWLRPHVVRDVTDDDEYQNAKLAR